MVKKLIIVLLLFNIIDKIIFLIFGKMFNNNGINHIFFDNVLFIYFYFESLIYYPTNIIIIKLLMITFIKIQIYILLPSDNDDLYQILLPIYKILVYIYINGS